MIRSILRTSSIYAGVMALSKVLTTLTFIGVARAVTPSDFGQIGFFYLTIYVSAAVSQVGLSYFYQKNASGKNSSELLNDVYQAHTVTLLVSLMLLMPLFFQLKVFTPIQLIVWPLAYFAHAYAELSRGYYLTHASPYKIGFKPALESIPLLLGLIFIRSQLNPNTLALLASFGFGISFLALVPFSSIWARFNFSLKKAILTLKKSTPFALLIITSLAYARGDQLIIKFSLSNTALGMYGVAYRFLEMFALIPSAVSQNLFSITSQKKGATHMQILKLAGIMLVVGGLIGGGILLFAQPIILMILGNAYADAIIPLQIFGLVILLFFVNAPFATHVQSSSLIKSFLPFGIANTVLNLILNLAFVPIYGIIAAALIMLITEITGLLINYYFSRRVFAQE